ncbi:class I SAM-dependent methyltransferase [Achromobacter aegrifaciens]|uniref:class I SAM-dependent methyltransferase n=1 Tax=Achromobacter aegrifaciens TaxID=1287736 RepID=UPI0028AB72D9|nr:class I SAM-dependent methyltransferase [Achromobacter aegrifaciens]
MSTARLRPSERLSPRQYDVAGLPVEYFNPGELAVLLHLFESVSPRVVIEFGVNAGRTPVAVLRNLPTVSRYVGVDVLPGYQTLMPVQRNEVPKLPGGLVKDDPRFELVLRERGSFDLAVADLPRADAIFIDADHSREGVMNDYRLARALVRPGGIIAFHDDNCRQEVQVTETLNELCASGAQIVHVHNTWISYERH